MVVASSRIVVGLQVQTLNTRVVAFGPPHSGSQEAHHVADVHEVAGLPSIAVDVERHAASRHQVDEIGNNQIGELPFWRGP